MQQSRLYNTGHIHKYPMPKVMLPQCVDSIWLVRCLWKNNKVFGCFIHEPHQSWHLVSYLQKNLVASRVQLDSGLPLDRVVEGWALERQRQRVDFLKLRSDHFPFKCVYVNTMSMMSKAWLGEICWSSVRIGERRGKWWWKKKPDMQT